MLRSILTLFWIMFFVCSGAIAAGSLSSIEVAKTLGALGEGKRYNAIASLARSGQIRSPLSGSDGASILLGTTQGARASSIAELAPLFKTDLNGQEAEAILGPEATLSESHRFNAIAALARAKRFGPSLGEDAALALKGVTQGSRASAIAEIAPYLRADLPGQAIATILGSGALLSDSHRFNAIVAIARSGKKPVSLSGPDGASILLGTTQGARASSIAELAPLFKTDLNGQEAEAILGPEATLSESHRFNAIAALARAKRFGPSLGEDAALALKGATQGSRASAIGEIAPYLRTDLPGQAIATILGSGSILSDSHRYHSIAALVRAGKLHASLSGDEMNLILLGMSGQARVSAIAEVANAAKQQAASPQVLSTGKIQPSVTTSDTCGAPFVAIDKPLPTCRERWQTVIFRQGVGNIFFATNEYIDAWQRSAATGEKLAKTLATIADMALLTKSVMKEPELAKNAATILTKGNSLLLMVGFENPEDTLGLQMAEQAVSTMRSGVEALVDYGLNGVVSPMGVAPDVMKFANSLLAYANTVRYARMRNTYTVALEYLRLLYRMGGDQTAFARSLRLSGNASVKDCINAVNKKSFRFPTSWTDANAYDPMLVEKLVNHWVLAISDYAALKAQ